MVPSWYGKRHPIVGEMEGMALSYGVQIAFHIDFDVPRYVFDENMKPWVIAIPEPFGDLARLWGLAHELGHLVQHGSPPRSKEEHLEQEGQADAWGACALIPESKIREYGNPNVHGFVAYLRKHYQHFSGKKEDRIRALAYRIAFTRIAAIKEVA